MNHNRNVEWCGVFHTHTHTHRRTCMLVITVVLYDERDVSSLN